jgi:hypothetical protein
MASSWTILRGTSDGALRLTVAHTTTMIQKPGTYDLVYYGTAGAWNGDLDDQYQALRKTLSLTAARDIRAARRKVPLVDLDES